MQLSNQPPMFLLAKSPMQLRLMMRANNNKHSKRFHYFDFNQLKNGMHICWYEISETERLSKDG